MPAIFPAAGTGSCFLTRSTSGPHRRERLLRVVQSTFRRPCYLPAVTCLVR
jgi:hypothetical protein